MMGEAGGQQPRRARNVHFLVPLAACLTLASAVTQREGQEAFDKRIQGHFSRKEDADYDVELESGEVPERDYPKSLHDFYKGNWVLTNSTGVPKFKQTSGHLVFQIVTRAHGREIKHLRKPGRTPGKAGVKAGQNGTEGEDGDGRLVLSDGIVGEREDDDSSHGEKDSIVVVEAVDMVQVDLVLRDGRYSSVRDLHTYMQGIYHKSTGLLYLWTVCNSPECGMYMFGGPQADMKPPGFFGPDFVNGFMNEGNMSREDEVDGEMGYGRVGNKAWSSRMGRKSCMFKMQAQVAKRETFVDDEHEKPLEAISLSGNLSSVDCNLYMTVNATAMNFEVYYSKAIHYTLMVTAASFCQVLLLVRQIEYSNSRSSAVKVSMLTIGAQAIMDSYLCLMHLTTGIVVEALFNAFATAAFFKFMIFSIFEMRYLLIIWKARRPQGFQEGWNAMRRELSMLYSRFYGCLLAGIVVIYQMQHYSGALVLGMYSFWIPQIVHNIQHDHRRPLLVRYIVGVSATRLLIPLYALACPSNFLHAQPNTPLALALLAWQALQVLILVAQHYRGPRFFVPRRFRPHKYDYYRRIPMTEMGASAAEAHDCAICMMPVMSADEPRGSPRVVTPCDHVFHQDCLTRWMDIKMECPVCRRPVPEIEDD